MKGLRLLLTSTKYDPPRKPPPTANPLLPGPFFDAAHPSPPCRLPSHPPASPAARTGRTSDTPADGAAFEDNRTLRLPSGDTALVQKPPQSAVDRGKNKAAKRLPVRRPRHPPAGRSNG